MHSKPLGKTAADTLSKRGAETRQALIDAGLELFGERGFQATSTRLLAERAGANVSAIPYHFHSKEGLYRAVVEHIATEVARHLGPVHDEISAELAKEKLTRSEAKRAITKLMAAFVRLFVESAEPRHWALIVMREQVRPTAAFELLYQIIMRKIHNLLSSLIGTYSGLDPSSDEVKIRAHALLGQVLIFLSSRETILRELQVSQLDERHVELIQRVLQSHVAACLKSAAADPDMPSKEPV